MSARGKQPYRPRTSHTSHHLVESVKRARAAFNGTLECIVIDPSKGSTIEGFEMIGSSGGNGFAPKHLTVCVRFDPSTNPTFGRLWMKFDFKMMRLEDATEPFTDLNAPLASMNHRFYLIDWKPEYEALCAELAVFKYTHTLVKLEEGVHKAQKALEDAQAALDLIVAKRTECAALLEEEKNKQ